MIDGFLYRLREVKLSDASFILNLRNNEELNRFINATSDSLELQELWLKDYFSNFPRVEISSAVTLFLFAGETYFEF